ncbi:Transcriptional regulator, LysR family [Pseudomonas sp. R4-34-07]|uniref:LysR family transcriptional regulator n=1 Tax=unclassified Pseudomonas TaxID=196821 RepID=UPI000F566843|nr:MULTISPECIES: LysR family transcriptional regulator [unclassified Pseudomonas]AZF37441.1 Transcriptional regulator, LysR family [Pseudomonas sp. R4-39-08]AZF53107.1 Transcriptional regulator, LysR family [Pseudomonas sp. R4-34-07]
MDIEELQTFVEVADAGGVSPAAARLGVSKSIVSRRLARLEAQLGVQLLTRSTRGAALTEAGATFRDYAARVCSEMESAREAILPAGALQGRLRVAAPLSFGPTHFAPVLAEMAVRHPQLQIQTCYSDRFVDLIAEGYDCAIRVGYLQDSNLIARRIGPINGKLVASPGYIKAYGSPEKPEEIVAHQALMQSTEAWQFMDGDKIVAIRPQGRFKADNGIALVAAAVAGLGVAYLPDCLTYDSVASGALVPIMTRYPPPPAGAYLVRPAGQHPAQKIRVFAQLLIEYFGKSPYFAGDVAV